MRQGIPKTWRQVIDHPAVESVEDNPGEEVRYWIHLKPGYSASNDPHSVHSGNGETVREAIADTFPVIACKCEDCRHLAAVEAQQIAAGVPQ